MNHHCIGCGICAAVCSHQKIEMQFNKDDGFYRPTRSLTTCDLQCGHCKQVCPFVPENPATQEMTAHYFAANEGTFSDDILGYYLQTYEGYSVQHRPQGSSGGLVTWLLETLISRGDIDGAICVVPTPDSPTLFDFKVCESISDIYQCSGSCYQPVEISRALRNITLQKGRRYAVVALPCFAKGLRLALDNNDHLKSQIRFILGLVCGQLKSRHFVEYLCRKHIGRNNPTKIRFRHKRPEHPATNYAYEFTFADGSAYTIGWKESISKPWRERLFTLEACDYCDDVFAEGADATFMDAWLPEYSNDSRGHSFVIIRSPDLHHLVEHAKDQEILHIAPISPKKLCESQQGVIRQKRVHARLNSNRIHNNSIQQLCLRSIKIQPTLSDYIEAWLKSRIRKLSHRGIGTSLLKFDQDIDKYSMLIKLTHNIFKLKILMRKAFISTWKHLTIC